jgi:glycosyltransferase involved in cell wall biosynthesis
LRQVSHSWDSYTPEPREGLSIEPGQRVIVVVPTLNEESGIGPVLDRMGTVLEPYDHHVLVVDGHSSDSTVKIAQNKGAFTIFQPSNGYGDALKAGFAYACNLGARVIVMVDGDGTYAPSDIPAVIDPILANESDVVVGNRFGQMDTGAMPLINIIGNRILSLVAKMLLEVDVSDTQCGLRSMRADLLRRVRIESEGMPFAVEMLAKFKKAGAKITEVPVSYHARHGESKMRIFKDGFAILRKILAEAEFR